MCAVARAATLNNGHAARPARIRVLLVEWNEDGTVGGSHRLLFDLSRNLDPAVFEPVVLFYQQNRFCDLLRAEGIEVFVYDDVRRQELHVMQHGGRLKKYADFLRGIVRRARLLRSVRADLVHLINSPWHGADLWLPACRISGIPCVATAGGLVPKTLGPLQRLLVRRFDRILAVSQSVADALRQFGATANVQVLYPGVDRRALCGSVHRSRDETREELGVSPEAILITMAGNIRPWKGQDVVVDAMARLPVDVRRRLHLLFVGSTAPEHREYEGRIREAAKGAGLDSCLTFLGERRDVAELFSASDLALHASVRPEPFGLVLVEALAVGTPVIASNRGGPTEILATDCGFLFDPDDAGELACLIELLVCDPDRFRQMPAAARARADRFSIERLTSGVQAAYRSILGAGSPRRDGEA